MFITGSVPRDFPPGRFDLIVLSEVLYYFVASDLARVAERCGEALQSDGEIVLCHWLGETDYPLTGKAASEIFARHISRRLPVRTIVRDDVYRLERFSRQAGSASPPPTRVARGGEGSGVGGGAAFTEAAVPADRPPTPDPSPPLRGGRGEPDPMQ